MYLKVIVDFIAYNYVYVEMFRDVAYILNVFNLSLVATSRDAIDFQNAVFKR